MNTIKLKLSEKISDKYIGIVEWEDGDIGWYKNGYVHREDGPAYIEANGIEEWYLQGVYIWHSKIEKFDLKNYIVLSKEQHPEYPTVQVWKYIDGNRIREQIIIPGMEAWIIE